VNKGQNALPITGGISTTFNIPFGARAAVRPQKKQWKIERL